MQRVDPSGQLSIISLATVTGMANTVIRMSEKQRFSIRILVVLMRSRRRLRITLQTNKLPKTDITIIIEYKIIIRAFLKFLSRANSGYLDRSVEKFFLKMSLRRSMSVSLSSSDMFIVLLNRLLSHSWNRSSSVTSSAE